MSSRAFRRRIVRYVTLLALAPSSCLGCRVIELGKPPQGGAGGDYTVEYGATVLLSNGTCTVNTPPSTVDPTLPPGADCTIKWLKGENAGLVPFFPVSCWQILGFRTGSSSQEKDLWSRRDRDH